MHAYVICYKQKKNQQKNYYVLHLSLKDSLHLLVNANTALMFRMICAVKNTAVMFPVYEIKAEDTDWPE